MKYSNYFKGKVREQGGDQFNLNLFMAVFNLVHLEGTLKAWEKEKEVSTNKAHPRNMTLKLRTSGIQ